MSDETFVPVSDWIAALISTSQAELERRGLRLHLELEEGFVIESAPDFEAAFETLLGFVLRSVPDGCEIYLAGSRRDAPVSRIGDGQFTLRWQILDRDDAFPAAGEGRVVALRSSPVDGASPVQAGAPWRIRERFDAAGWHFSLDSIGGGKSSGKELVVHVSRR